MARAATLTLLAGLAAGFALPAAAQDAAAGQRVFNQCRACHTIDAGGRNGVGPNLHGIVGRKAASIEGFRYSADMRAKAEAGLTWTEDQLRPYITNPKAVVPAGSMSFPGLRNEQQLNDLIAYLRANS
ncbi:cytochrome c family protein [Siccirubricoccus sp. KC 17139]|uniref:Cytochrome c family protein n=1 Tax=Siccirubricoccus soli TaxID=2899147 RepID=A0ABT1D6U8_9PROT|nr:cytochrome c family protein [Siccirubricoccus soli]MCO6417604.1 cytochrome c family protein [Siccirubricoccus soli]MCP2683739.1 cytochrome c family protein [Siccirubricoccus soli]